VHTLRFGEVEIQAVFLELLVEQRKARAELLWGLSSQGGVVDEKEKGENHGAALGICQVAQ